MKCDRENIYPYHAHGPSRPGVVSIETALFNPLFHKDDVMTFSELLKKYKTTRMSGYEFIDALVAMGHTREVAMLIHEAATRTY